MRKTKPENTDQQRKRRRGAIISAAAATLWLAAVGLAMLWLRTSLEAGSFGSKALLILAAVELIAIIPVWINLKARLKEIKGGEEDVAAQY